MVLFRMLFFYWSLLWLVGNVSTVMGINHVLMENAGVYGNIMVFNGECWCLWEHNSV